MKMSSSTVAILYLSIILTSCAGNKPTSTPANETNKISTFVAATLTAIPSITPVVEPATAQLPSLTPTTENGWEQHYIDLYGFTINLPHNWQIKEINRRAEPTGEGDPIEGHDCADYQISSYDGLSALFLRPICGFSDGVPGAYPPGTIVINPDSSDRKIGRYFNGAEYVYSKVYIYTYTDLTGDHIDMASYSPPVIVIGEGQDLTFLGSTFQYLRPKEDVTKALEIADKIILSITKP
jgi:hypothetical protein